MPSDYETRFAANAADRLLTKFGRPGTYTPPKGTAIPVLKLGIGRVTEQTATKDGVMTVVRESDLMVRVSEVTTPVLEGRFICEGETWTVVERPEKRNGIWKMKAQWTTDQRFNVIRAEK